MTCEVQGCSNKMKTTRFCSTHYKQDLRRRKSSSVPTVMCVECGAPTGWNQLVRYCDDHNWMARLVAGFERAARQRAATRKRWRAARLRTEAAKLRNVIERVPEEFRAMFDDDCTMAERGELAALILEQASDDHERVSKGGALPLPSWMSGGGGYDGPDVSNR